MRVHGRRGRLESVILGLQIEGPSKVSGHFWDCPTSLAQLRHDRLDHASHAPNLPALQQRRLTERWQSG